MMIISVSTEMSPKYDSLYSYNKDISIKYLLIISVSNHIAIVTYRSRVNKLCRTVPGKQMIKINK